MSFASLIFLYFFLPAVLAGYYILPRRWRNPFLLAANLVFYGWGEPWFLPVILLTALVNWLIGRRMAACTGRRGRRRWLIAALALDLGLLAAFKYTGFVLQNLGLEGLLPARSRCRWAFRSTPFRWCPMCWTFTGTRCRRRTARCALRPT